VRDNHILHLVVPETEVNEFMENPRADDSELLSKDTKCVDVAVGISKSA